MVDFDFQAFSINQKAAAPRTRRLRFNGVDHLMKSSKRSKRPRRDQSVDDDLVECLVMLARSGGGPNCSIPPAAAFPVENNSADVSSGPIQEDSDPAVVGLGRIQEDSDPVVVGLGRIQEDSDPAVVGLGRIQGESDRDAVASGPVGKENELVTGPDCTATAVVDYKKRREGSFPAMHSIPTPINSYKCKICSKSFQSYQALGGYKASHRGKLPTATATDDGSKNLNTVSPLIPNGRRHVCSTCHMSFPSGQALGGHMRKHFDGVIKSAKFGSGSNSSSDFTFSDGRATNQNDGVCLKNRLPLDFDLNLPPPAEAELTLAF